MLRCYEPAHIVGISKTAYVLATPRCLEWRRDLQRTSTKPTIPDPRDSSSPRCRVAAACSSSSRRSPRRLGYQSPATVVLDGASPIDRPRAWRAAGRRHGLRSVEHRGALGEADGAVPDGTTVFDDEVPGVANLDPRSSVPCARPRRMPRTTASSSSSTAAGVPRSTRSSCSVRRSRSTAPKRRPPDGWPPPTRLLTCRGTRSTSGPPMPRRGCPSTAPQYGLCQIYGNEPWHYELRPEAIDHGCPPMYADPTHDPRMQQ